MPLLDDAGLDLVFRTAQTHYGWQKREVPDDLLRRLYDLARIGPTSLNASPMRIVFVRSPEAKARLEPALSSNNREKTMAAPVCAIVAYDPKFYELLPRLFPHMDARPWFATNAPFAEQNAFRNGSIQGGYLILAARALGLDCGPMSGFDNAKVDAAFFPDGAWKSNFLCNLGYGDRAKLRDRGPRLSFDEACRIE